MRTASRTRAHHPCQGAELGVDIFDLGGLGTAGEPGFPRKGAVEGAKVEVGESGRGTREIVGMAILLKE
jgi:hypothetical protein